MERANRRSKTSLERTLIRDGIEVRVSSHAVRQYYNRIKGRDVRFSSGKERDDVRQNIADSVTRPDAIYHGKKDMAPIHLLGPFATVVEQQESNENGIYVPTVYKREVFDEDNVLRET